uniref:DUF4219 domain-containing protein n=1 Tax=Salix viminalis TaxID=40686 RepID=A0A6N2N939_SALVM
MATTSYNLQNEGASTSRPPFFDGNDYAYWKARMTIYLQSIDFDLWLSIENGSHRPIKTENGIEIPKSMIEYTDLDKRNFLRKKNDKRNDREATANKDGDMHQGILERLNSTFFYDEVDVVPAIEAASVQGDGVEVAQVGSTLIESFTSEAIDQSQPHLVQFELH